MTIEICSEEVGELDSEQEALGETHPLEVHIGHRAIHVLDDCRHASGDL
jgi:hypothetical protein